MNSTNIIEGKRNRSKKRDSNYYYDENSSSSVSDCESIEDGLGVLIEKESELVDSNISNMSMVVDENETGSRSNYEIWSEREPFIFTGNDGVDIDVGNDQYLIFTSIFDDKIVEHISEQTNLYASQYLTRNKNKAPGREKNWKDTNKEEIYVL